MADVFSKKKRSDIMSRVKGRDNAATELRLIRIFQQQHITGWRRHVAIFGNPDFVFPKARLVIFVDGCFWHGCPKHASRPIHNRTFWHKKLGRNKLRDRLVNRTLNKHDWRVFRVWQHELIHKNEENLALRIRKSLNRIRSRQR